MDFGKRYTSLNKAQKQAVDCIDGPVMVVAGPGTGKTELLSVRVANILQKTDTLPENILCLTFTDSGADAMRERLIGIIGKDAYKVGIHTFHSFGTEIINQYGEFFYGGANFRPADELSSYEIIRTIFEELDRSNPLAKKLNDEFIYLKDCLQTISELKKSSLTSSELLAILDENNSVIEKAEQLLKPIFANKISLATVDKASQVIDDIRSSDQPVGIPAIVQLSTVMADSLQTAIDEARSLNKTNPITAWRNAWMTKDSDGDFVLKSSSRQTKLRTVAWIYEQYLNRMERSELFDFDDMILQVVHAVEIFDDLRFNLQEKYQYIMVDEFQDTNLAQMRILHNLTNNPASEGKPNIMVVGDDDQAIYSFQGADINNILDFMSNYPSAEMVTLTDNYRSIDQVLTDSRKVISQANDRLESRIESINKQLVAKSGHLKGHVTLHQAENILDERSWLVKDIKAKIASGVEPSEIAVLTRRHHQIAAILPYFSQAGIAVSYERRDNVLDQPQIKIIEQICRITLALNSSRFDEVDAGLPELLANDLWNKPSADLYKLSLSAYKNRITWLEAMESDTEYKQIKDWLINLAAHIDDIPLEQIIDIIIGKTDDQIADDDKSGDDIERSKKQDPKFVSPFFEHFFSKEKLDSDPDQYLTYLEGLRTIRSKLRDFRPSETPTLRTFIEFISLHRKLGTTISAVRKSAAHSNAINIMTAHKSKGLEFNNVYIIEAVDNSWGERVRGRSRLISYPENLPLASAGDTSDERLRLFYVAMTRAKSELNISYSLTDAGGKTTMLAAFLASSDLDPQPITNRSNMDQLIESAQTEWYQAVISNGADNLHAILKPTLENYKLSVTHMNNFLDVTRGGPTTFLLQNLLRFPQAISPNAAYGSAIHFALWRAHLHLSAHKDRQPIEDVISNFSSNLLEKRLKKSDYDHFLQKGVDTLHAFLGAKYETFLPGQKVELNFAGQQSIVGEAHLTGSLDLVDIDEDKSVTVTDYKTGSAPVGWNGKADYEKIKLHKYRQQLMFYKLLVENASGYRGHVVNRGVLQFVEPNTKGLVVNLETDFDEAELKHTADLINAVWKKIINLDMPDTSGYEQNIKGILAFEQDLLEGAK